MTVNVCNNGPTITRLNTFMFGGTMQEFAAFVSPLAARATRSGPRRLGAFDRRTLLLHCQILRP